MNAVTLSFLVGLIIGCFAGLSIAYVIVYLLLRSVLVKARGEDAEHGNSNSND